MTQPDNLTIEEIEELQPAWHHKSIGEQNELWDAVSEQLAATMRENVFLRKQLELLGYVQLDFYRGCSKVRSSGSR